MKMAVLLGTLLCVMMTATSQAQVTIGGGFKIGKKGTDIIIGGSDQSEAANQCKTDLAVLNEKHSQLQKDYNQLALENQELRKAIQQYDQSLTQCKSDVLAYQTAAVTKVEKYRYDCMANAVNEYGYKGSGTGSSESEIIARQQASKECAEDMSAATAPCYQAQNIQCNRVKVQ